MIGLLIHLVDAALASCQADGSLKQARFLVQPGVRLGRYAVPGSPTMRVLLIEDDHVLGGAIRDHVLSTGHAVDWMQRLDDARLALASVPYELVLLDLNLPDGRGLDLLKELRSTGNAVPVIITTAQDQVAIVF